ASPVAQQAHVADILHRIAHGLRPLLHDEYGLFPGGCPPEELLLAIIQEKAEVGNGDLTKMPNLFLGKGNARHGWSSVAGEIGAKEERTGGKRAHFSAKMSWQVPEKVASP